MMRGAMDGRAAVIAAARSIAVVVVSIARSFTSAFL
jgi:hypothetical protein